jgi:predicted Rossmann fold flavoprotein
MTRQEPIRRDVVVLGAGAAGLFAAIEAGKRGRSVTVIERAESPGKKILISGGGRCNFTNLHSGPEHFLSENPDFCRSALARYQPADFVGLVERHGIRWHEKKAGQLFCDGSAREIVAMLLAECRAAAVEVVLDCVPGDVGEGDRFLVETSRGPYSAEALVVATGGLSIPKIGATDAGHRLARHFGIALVEPRPGLVPLVFGDADRRVFGELAGVSFEALVRSDGAAFRESALFTHRGLSGPAVLQASSYWRPGEPVVVDLLPGEDLADLAADASPGIELKTLLSRRLPRRLAHTWTERNAASRPLAQYGRRELADVDARLHAWIIVPAATEGFAKAEVTCGGVDVNELSSKTMEARRVSGLYFVGEVVDVTGHLGGHNFQWAWASGFAAGQAA